MIGVYFRRIGNYYELSICDDGIGMPEDFDLNDTQSMGLEIICILTEQLEGKIEFERSKGSKFMITFPER